MFEQICLNVAKNNAENLHLYKQLSHSFISFSTSWSKAPKMGNELM